MIGVVIPAIQVSSSASRRWGDLLYSGLGAMARRAARSAETILWASSLKVTLGCQFSFWRDFEAGVIRRSSLVGRLGFGLRGSS